MFFTDLFQAPDQFFMSCLSHCSRDNLRIYATNDRGFLFFREKKKWYKMEPRFKYKRPNFDLYEPYKNEYDPKLYNEIRVPDQN